MVRIGAPFLLAALFLGIGCAQPSPELTLSSHDSAVKIETLKKIAAERKADSHLLAQIVMELDHPDGAVRLYAIRTLRELTGRSFDYRYYDDQQRRQHAISAWKSWLRGQNAPTTQSTASGTGG